MPVAATVAAIFYFFVLEVLDQPTLVRVALVIVAAYLGIKAPELFLINAAKVFQGGWVPVLVAAVVSVMMAVWMAGRRRLSEKLKRDDVPLQVLLDNLSKRRPTTVPGTAVFLTSEIETVPAIPRRSRAGLRASSGLREAASSSPWEKMRSQ